MRRRLGTCISLLALSSACLHVWVNHCLDRLEGFSLNVKLSPLARTKVCKHPFVFENIYAEDAPKHLPFHELLLGMCQLCARGARFAFRVRNNTWCWLPRHHVKFWSKIVQPAFAVRF